MYPLSKRKSISPFFFLRLKYEKIGKFSYIFAKLTPKTNDFNLFPCNIILTSDRKFYITRGPCCPVRAHTIPVFLSISQHCPSCPPSRRLPNAGNLSNPKIFLMPMEGDFISFSLCPSICSRQQARTRRNIPLQLFYLSHHVMEFSSGSRIADVFISHLCTGSLPGNRIKTRSIVLSFYPLYVRIFAM